MVPIAPTQVSPVQGVEVNCCAINELYNNYCCATSGQHCLQYLNLIFNLPIYVYKRDGIHSGPVPFGLMHLGPGPDPFGPIHLGYGPNLIGPIHLDTGRLGMFIWAWAHWPIGPIAFHQKNVRSFWKVMCCVLWKDFCEYGFRLETKMEHVVGSKTSCWLDQVNLSGWGICSSGICCPWMRGEWGLDAQREFLRRHHCRRRARSVWWYFLDRIIGFSPGQFLKNTMCQKNGSFVWCYNYEKIYKLCQRCIIV